MLEQEIVLVTGASRGIGQAIADDLGSKGATVIGTATSQDGADAIGARLAAAGIKGKGLCLNVTDPDSVNAVIKAITDEFGTITVLVNNAGITRDGLLMRMKDEDWDAIINTNLSSVYRLSKAVLRGMTKAKHGRIINIGSVVGLSGNPGQTNYAAAKAGVIGFSKSLAREVGVRGITVNTVAPGFIDTDMTRSLNDDQKTAILSGIPMARLGTPAEIAGVVSFLASAAAGYITGETINVNGGMYMC